MNEKELSIDTITFGQYKDQKIDIMLKDRKYCKWILEQDWFEKNYEYLFNKVLNYQPKKYFLNDSNEKTGIFMDDYIYFNYDEILDLYIIIEKVTEIYIIHNSWNDTLILNNYSNTLKRKSVESETGKFEYNNNKIIIYWDKWDKEVFVKNKDVVTLVLPR